MLKRFIFILAIGLSLSGEMSVVAAERGLESCARELGELWQRDYGFAAKDIRPVPSPDEAFGTRLDELLFVADSHGSLQRIKRVHELLSRYRFDFLAMEQLADGQLDPRWQEFYLRRNGEQALSLTFNPPLQELMTFAQNRAVSLISLSKHSEVWSKIPSPRELADRNREMATRIPSKGRGLVFIGGLHLLAPHDGNIQNFLSRTPYFLESF